MALNKVELCGIDTGKLPVLSAKEAAELFSKVKEGDDQARERFIFANLRLVLSVIHRFSRRCDNVDDLFQVGCIGLMKAVDNFDNGVGVRFSTYAVPMIIGEIRRYLRDNNPIRVSRSMRDTAYKALQAAEKLSFENNREPDIEEIAREIDMPVHVVSTALEAIQDPVSIYEPIYHDGSDAAFMVDQLGDERATGEAWLNNLALDAAVSRLDERERSIIFLRYFQGRTQMEIAQEIGISQAQVSRLEKGAVERIKKQV